MRMSGEECYELSLSYLKRYKEQTQKMEEDQAQEQYQAMMEKHTKDSTENSAFTNKAHNRQANIAVVKTIVKQTRIKQKDQVSQQLQQNVHKEKEDLEKEAKKFMQYAAFIHGHPPALVQMANEALQLAKSQGSKVDYKERPSSSNKLSNNPLFKFLDTSKMSTIFTNQDLVTFQNITSSLSFTDLAKRLYQEAVDRGNNDAMFNLAHLLWTEAEETQSQQEKGGEKTNEYYLNAKLESLRLFRQAAFELGDIDALYFLGVQFMTLFGSFGDDDVEEDETLSYFHDKILKDISKEYEELGTSKVREELRQHGFNMICKASAQNHSGASYYLSLVYRNGDEMLNIEQDLENFRIYLDLACDLNDSDALYLRSYCIYHKEDGYDIQYSLKDALLGFIDAGKAGNSNGYISAGAMLHRGHGSDIPQNQRKAFEYYQEAAEMGSQDGWKNVVACYALGQGVPKCDQTAKYIIETMLDKDDIVNNDSE